MAKSTQNKRKSRKSIETPKAATLSPDKPLIPVKYQDLTYIGILCLLIFIFISGALFGGGFSAGDNIASMSFDNYLKEAAKNGEFPLWTPYIFGGMPSYASLLTTGERFWDFIPIIVFGINKFIGWIFESDAARVAVFYCYYAIGMYLLMITKKHDKFVAFFTSFAAVFSTSIIVWMMIGHSTKPVVFGMFPFAFLLIEKIREKFSIVYTVLLIFAIHIMFEGAHLQMIYYIVIAFGVYFVFELINRAITKNNLMGAVRAGVVLALAGIIAFLMSSDRYFSTMEYTQYSTRGTSPIEQSSALIQEDSDEKDYNYSTQYSFSPAETMVFFNPSFFGFGKRDYTIEGARDREIKLYAYWGQKEAEDAPPYMGIFILGLAIIGVILNRKVVFVQYLVVLSIIAWLVAMGKNMPWFYDLLYYNLPYFDKFRAPSMILAMMQFSVPIMAGYGLSSLIKLGREGSPLVKKVMRITLIISAGYLILGFLYSIAFKESYIESINAKFGQMYPPEIITYIYDSMVSDWYITAALAIGFFGMLWAYLAGKLNGKIFYFIAFALLMLDLWRVAYRPMEIQEKKETKDMFKPSDAVQFMQQDTSLFRIANMTRQSPNQTASYLLQSVNGYHAAKLRVYQDLMDVSNIGGAEGHTSMLYNPFLWNMMNVKYIYADQQMGQGMQPIYQSQYSNELVYYNPSMLPRAFFVAGVEKAEPLQILKKLKAMDFDPLDIAYVEEDLDIKLDAPGETAKATVTEFKNEYIKAEVEATGSNLLFFGEIYYPAGWKAYIDGEEVPIIKTNYAFRSVVVPKGKHTVEMKFVSVRFELGYTISFALNIATILALAGGLFIAWNNKKKKKVEEKTEE